MVIMTRANAISFLCLAVGIWNMVQHRDISANQYLGAFLVIQALKARSPEKLNSQWERINLLCIIMGMALCLFSIFALVSGFEWDHPKSW